MSGKACGVHSARESPTNGMAARAHVHGPQYESTKGRRQDSVGTGTRQAFRHEGVWFWRISPVEASSQRTTARHQRQHGTAIAAGDILGIPQKFKLLPSARCEGRSGQNARHQPAPVRKQMGRRQVEGYRSNAVESASSHRATESGGWTSCRETSCSCTRRAAIATAVEDHNENAPRVRIQRRMCAM